MMPRVMVFLMTLMFVLPSDGSSQAAPSPGDRIRIKQVDGTVLTGTLATLSAETIQLSVGSVVRRVPVERIERLETSLGRSMSGRNIILLTMAATSVVGATIGAIAWKPCSWFCVSPFESETRSGAIFAGFGLGALVGLPLGAIIGSVVREERWNPVSLSAPSVSGLTIRPVIGSGVGFAASVRVGGL